MHRSTGWVIRASLTRQDHSWPLWPYQTRDAPPLRSSRIRHLRMDLVSFMLASPMRACFGTNWAMDFWISLPVIRKLLRAQVLSQSRGQRPIR